MSKNLPLPLHDPNKPPSDNDTGQAIWNGQNWEFIAYAFGRPLIRRYATLAQACRASAIFEEEAAETLNLLNSVLRDRYSLSFIEEKMEHHKEKSMLLQVRLSDVDLPPECQVYALEELYSDMCLLVINGRQIKHEMSYNIALEESRRLSASTSSGPNNP